MSKIREGYPIWHGKQAFYPIPDWWLDYQGAVDQRDGDDPRLFAVSFTELDKRTIQIRYLHPKVPRALVLETASVDMEQGVAPVGLTTAPRWPRSIYADGEQPVDVSRPCEMKHLRALWADRCVSVPADGESVPEVQR